jgi:enoyl-CoA hydratase/carnithine racemase
MAFETLTVHKEGGVLLAEIAAPPINLLGSEPVRDLVSLIQPAEAEAIQLLVFKSADPDTFISYVDVTRIAEYRAEAAKLTGEASIALLFRHLSASRLVIIAQIEGRVRAAGSEFVLACDMRFAARESAIFAHFDAAFGLLPGGGAAQHLTRLMGRARTLEVMLSAADYDAELADDVVALKEAWDSGAKSWSATDRSRFHNDLGYAWTLDAVTDNVNSAKGDSDPAQWLPPLTSARCTYAIHWVAIKYRWRLSVDSTEKAKLSSILSGTCGARTLTIPPRAR